jgi:hypothetical protein
MEREMSQPCTLEAALGHPEPCPGPTCPFWADEGEGRCVFEAIQLELSARPPVADYLLMLRRSLEEAARLKDDAASERGTHGA